MARVKMIVNRVVESEIARFLLENPDYTAVELKRKVERSLKQKGFNYKFTDRTYLNKKKEFAPNINKENPLDKPWTVGACIKYDISPDVIPVLIKIMQVVVAGHITIRQARWFARLYPSVQKLMRKQSQNQNFISTLQTLSYSQHELGIQLPGIELVSEEQISKLREFYRSEPEQSNQHAELTWLVLIGVSYAKAEQVSELVGEDYPDTSELDKLLLIPEDLSIEALIDGGRSAFATPKQRKQREDILANFKGLSSEELELKFGKLTPHQVDYVNDLLHAVTSGFVSAHKWEEQHPEEYAEIKKLWEAKEHERLHSQEG